MASSGGIVDSALELKPGLLTVDPHALARLAVALIVVPLASLFLWFTVSWATSPLRKFPGPFLAGFTNLWRLYQVRQRDYHVRIKKLHDQYGPVVRIGPNTLDIDYPELIRTIYSTDGKWRKTEFYHNNSAVVNGKIAYTIFSTTDQAEHARMKRPLVKYYNQGAVLALEPHMDAVIADFIKHLDTRFAKPAKPCNLGDWVAFYAWDLIGSVTFSNQFGYMKEGRDFDRTLAIADQMLDYFAAVGQIPWLDYLLDKNPVMRIGPPNLSNVTRIALESIGARVQGKDPHFDPAVPDYLAHFLESRKIHPDLVDDTTVFSFLLVNLLAGSDTTATTIRAVLYFCLKNPRVYQKLVREIRAQGFDPDKPVGYAAAHKVEYLDAAVKEAMRMHPAVGMLLERYVPEGGLALPDGRVVPAGAAVGLNPYVTGRNRAWVGEDPDEFRPERWLRAEGESEEAYKQRLQRMQQADLAFGAGSRICLGRHLALMEVYKIVALLVNRYDIELEDPEREWEVTNSWFMRQEGLITKMTLRK